MPNYKLNITIGKHLCEPEHCTEQSLKCKTTKMTSISTDSLKVCTIDQGSLGYEINGCSVSLPKFNYIKTEVFEIKPNYGPIGGGTKITLIGNNLDSGSKRVVKIKESYCEEMSVNSTHLECLTKGIQIDNDDDEILKNINRNGKITFEIDENKYILDNSKKSDLKFEFKPNPTVIKYYPKAGLRDSNINVTITGKYFTSAHNLQLKTTMYSSYLPDGKIFLFSKCLMLNNSTLNCKLPKVPESIKIKSSQVPLEAEISLIPDGDLNKSKIQSNTINFFYYPKPFFSSIDKLKNKVSIGNNKKGQIEIKGTNFSDQYPFEIKIIKLKNDVKNETSFRNINLTEKFILCKEKRVINFNLIKCQVDFSNESIEKEILNKVWLARVEINQNWENLQFIEFKFNEPSTSKIFFIIWFLVVLVILVSCLGTFYLHKTNRIEFMKEKKFPHFSVSYNGQLKDQTMLDSPFIRQSSQNGKLLKKLLLYRLIFNFFILLTI